ncbi:GAL4-like DNA-binding protein [Triangularia setosa]|uniref:GAL4-like DNA-binding protein n=1 Tax=Triangularia setosa TaxID=2587417 RepID=A0AAN6VZ86_9PEZI|nr:GAL4-like DNA-binding protein [Podospora setosa]
MAMDQTAPGPDTDQPLRQACDRCHSQKLRCPRSTSNSESDGKTGSHAGKPCSRCDKAGFPCIVSHRGRAGRPSKIVKKKAYSSSVSVSLPRATPPKNADGEISYLAQALDLREDYTHWSAGNGSPRSETPHHSFQNGRDDVLTAADTTPESVILSFNTHEDVTSPSFYILDSDTATCGLGGSHQEFRWSIPSKPLFTDPMPVEPPVGIAFELEPLPATSFSTTFCYHQLSDLNGKIMLSITDSIDEHQVLDGIVGFCGELIDIARSAATCIHSSKPLPAASDYTRDSSCSPGNGDIAESYADSVCCVSRTDADKMEFNVSSAWTNPFPTPQGLAEVPNSAVVFLLLACYTQILRLFEISVHKLWSRFRSDVPRDGPVMGKVGLLLEASLALRTVTYLLGRLNNAFDELTEGKSTCEQSSSSSREKEDGGSGSLGKAFGEMKEREELLMRTIKCLEQKINMSL